MLILCPGLLFLLLAAVLPPPSVADPDVPTEGDKPALLLARNYQEGADLNRYWISEKLDGQRAYWDGSRLLTRQGGSIHAPAWFTAVLPKQPLDGELWVGRGGFQETMRIVRDQRPDDAAWRRVEYMLFDLPADPTPFDMRLKRLRRLADAIEAPWVRVVAQFRVADHSALMAALEAVVAKGGEGLMLHRGDSYYRAGRSDDLLKLKPTEDAEALVVAYIPGRGKYRGLMGSLEVEDEQGRRFRIGTGFSDQQRRRPPALGAVITYRYRGRTEQGIPRFASFLRVRPEYEFPSRDRRHPAASPP